MPSTRGRSVLRTLSLRSITRVTPLRLLVLAALIAFLSCLPSFERDSEAKSGKTQVLAIEVGSIEEVVTAQGKLEPKEFVDVGTQVSGQLDTLHVDIGDEVAQGDIIAELDPRIYESRVQVDQARFDSLQAQLGEEKAQLELANQKLARNKKLFASIAVSQEVLQESQAAAKVAEAKVNVIAAQLKEIQSSLDGNMVSLGYTKIYAPISGTVVLKSAREGQTLNATQTAPTIIQLANLSTMTVRAQVAEADIPRVTVGMKVHFSTLGMLNKRWEGVVRQVLPSPEIINDVVLFNVLIDVDNSQRLLMTGMSTQVFFVIGEANDVPLLPVDALGSCIEEGEDSDCSAYEVIVESAKGREPRKVRVGLRTRTALEVKDGLVAGDRVVVQTPAAAPETSKGNRRFMRGPQL